MWQTSPVHQWPMTSSENKWNVYVADFNERNGFVTQRPHAVRWHYCWYFNTKCVLDRWSWRGVCFPLIIQWSTVGLKPNSKSNTRRFAGQCTVCAQQYTPRQTGNNEGKEESGGKRTLGWWWSRASGPLDKLCALVAICFRSLSTSHCWFFTCVNCFSRSCLLCDSCFASRASTRLQPSVNYKEWYKTYSQGISWCYNARQTCCIPTQPSSGLGIDIL